MTPPICLSPSLDTVDRVLLLRLLAEDARATYRELGQAVRLSANATPVPASFETGSWPAHARWKADR
ncbi:AsnC family transcriptional regulator [Streptomyces flaveolus]|uniref:AsnC family transcriptional regulator n=1 Tax=Streptomyces flaveolus TaxID=67297 RepID=A0ABV1VGN4_9ACTN